MIYIFNEFKNYARFLLENSQIFEELSSNYFTRVRSSNIPLMRFLKAIPAEKHKEITDLNIKNFLQQSLVDTAFQGAVSIIDQWKSNTLLGIPREEIEINDLIAVTNFRKQLYINFLDKYTHDLNLYRSIIIELDEFHMQFQKYAFDTYVEIHQEKLTDENRFVLSLINNSIDGILAFNKELKITELNKVLEEWNNIKKEDVIGKEVLDVFAPYAKVKAETSLVKVLQGEKVFIPESPFINRKGTYEANIVPIYDSQGQITGGLIITHETTKRKEAEENLKQAKLLLQDITNSIPDAITVVDFDTEKILFSNNLLGSLTGLRNEADFFFDRSTRENIISEEDLPIVFENQNEFKNLKEGEVSTFKFRVKQNQNKWKWISAKNKIFKWDETSSQAKVLCVFEDITHLIESQQIIQNQNEELGAALEELQAAEEQLLTVNEELEKRVQLRTEELSKREEQIRLITDSLPVLITYVDKEKRYRFNNKAYEDWFGKSRSEVYGKHVQEVLGEEFYNEVKDEIDRALNGESVEIDAKMYTKEGDLKFVSVNYIPDIKDGEVLGYYALKTDITDLVKAKTDVEFHARQLEEMNEKLLTKNNELTKLNIDLDNFIYTASHDLKAPISNLDGLIILFKKEFGNDFFLSGNNLIELIESSIHKLYKTILDLTEITKAQKHLNDERKEISFNEVIKEVLSDLEGAIHNSEATISQDLQIDKLIFNKSNLRSILYNLLSNAIKYRSEKRHLIVSVKSYQSSDNLIICVEDNGLGIGKAYQHKLFSMFRRFHTHVEGTGIGLYIIKRVVENNGGNITVESEEGTGSKFTVNLPLDI